MAVNRFVQTIANIAVGYIVGSTVRRFINEKVLGRRPGSERLPSLGDMQDDKDPQSLITGYTGSGSQRDQPADDTVNDQQPAPATTVDPVPTVDPEPAVRSGGTFSNLFRKDDYGWLNGLSDEDTASLAESVAASIRIHDTHGIQDAFNEYRNK